MTDKPIVLITHVKHFVGPAAVTRLLRDEMTVVCHDKDFEHGERRADFHNEHPGVETLEATEPSAIAAELTSRFGRIDALISNDPYPAIRAPIDEAGAEDLRRSLEALTVWPFTLINKLTRLMKQQKSGRILIVSSAAPLTGIPNYSIYAVARGAANAMVPSLARELARWGISVNAIAPNYIKNPDYFPPKLLSDSEAMAKMLKNIPLGRLGEPEEAAELIALFVSGRCNFVTGHVVPIAGGWA